MNTREIIAYMGEIAPEALQEEWDNSGPQIVFDRNVTRVLIAMDVTPRVILEAKEFGAEMILTHHPLFFSGLKSIDISTIRGKMVAELIQGEISVYSAHTNLDKVEWGTNGTWAERLDLKNVQVLDDGDEIGIIGEREMRLSELTEFLEGEGIDDIMGFGEKREILRKIAVLGGSGSDYMVAAKGKGADVFITGDMTHHKGQEAYERDLFVLGLTHYDSEKFVLETLEGKLKERCKTLQTQISQGTDFLFTV